ncbi:MAG TPA: DUF3800 domain-containing protein [Pirellulales bacterium]|jgi:hypothetical protein|nr:DUF3800 domain-containing protein [Pirellulales bacterium]
MLLFIDESGHDRSGTPCEVLAGVAVSEDNLWNMVRAIRSAERDHFGGYLRDLHSEETKGRKLLKTKRFRIASRNIAISAEELTPLANSLLLKGKEARAKGLDKCGETYPEMVAYSRQILNFVHAVLDIAASFSVQVFASVTDPNSPRPTAGQLRKDYVYLFERYFYFLETLPPRERGLIVFDELDKSKSHILVQQMAAYFLGHETGRYRSSRIVPEPFFVHSDLTTGILLADLTAYIIGWAWRLNRMTQLRRDELSPYATKLHDMQFHGEKPKPDGSGVWPLHGIVYIDDLRGRYDRLEEQAPEET